MTSSWKIGAVSGLIAGFIAGIVCYVCNLIVLGFGIPYNSEFHSGAPFQNLAEYYIIMGLIWGAILGIIFSKAYATIPSKKILKGICLGLLLFLFGAFRDVTFWIPYGLPMTIIFSHIFIWFFGAITYGLLIGILYRKDVATIGKFDLGKGFQVGVIAGLIGGVVAFLSAIPVNIWLYKLGETAFESGYLFSLAVNHITINAIWGVIFALIYTKVHSIVPGKGVLNGLIFSLIIFFCMESGHSATYYFAFGNFNSTIQTGLTGLVRAIAYGLVLGYLYRKPSD